MLIKPEAGGSTYNRRVEHFSRFIVYTSSRSGLCSKFVYTASGLVAHLKQIFSVNNRPSTRAAWGMDTCLGDCVRPAPSSQKMALDELNCMRCDVLIEQSSQWECRGLSRRTLIGFFPLPPNYRPIAATGNLQVATLLLQTNSQGYFVVRAKNLHNSP